MKIKAQTLLSIVLGSVAGFAAGAQAADSSACPEQVRSVLSKPHADLISCARAQKVYFVVQRFEGEDQDFAGVTLSVYDAAGFSGSSKPLAVETGLGDDSLQFKYGGKVTDFVLLEPTRDGKPGILLRTFNPPAAGVFFSYRFNPSTSKLELVSDDTVTDMGQVPEIKADGTMEVSGSSYDSNGNLTKFKVVYQYRDGKFTPKRSR